MKTIISLIILLSVSSVVYAEEPDFYLTANDCQMLIGSFAKLNVTAAKADPPKYACSRKGRQMNCVVNFDSSNPSGKKEEDFIILLDSPPFLYFTDQSGASFFSINISQHAAIMTFRMTDVSYTGEKVCSAKYTTSSELELMKK